MQSKINNSSAKPIPSIEHIERVRSYLKKKPRDLLLFDLATQTGINMSELLQLKAKDLYLNPGETIKALTTIASVSSPKMNNIIYSSFHDYISHSKLINTDYLFTSRNREEPIHIASISRLIRSWFDAVDLKGLSGAVSLRKTYEHFFADNAKPIVESQPNDMLNSLPPLKTPTLQESVYNELLDAIISGRIAPGTTLTIKKIAQQMHVSQMPVRDAIQRLSSEGFISSQRRKGSIVNKLSIENLEEIIEIRLQLELLAIRHAAIERSQESMDQLKKLHNRWIQLVTRQEFEKARKVTEEFHIQIYRSSNRPLLVKLIEGLRKRTSPYTSIYLTDTHNVEHMVKAHELILSALEKKDPDLSEKYLRQDIVEGAKITRKLMRQFRKDNLSH